MTDEYSFDGWGKLTSSTGSTANSQLYKGEYLAYRKDPDAGPELQYSTHHRNYNPQTGVFTAADPAKDDLNLYRYVKNNPVNEVDPSGLQSEDDEVLNRGYYGPLQREYWSSLRWQEGYKQLDHYSRVLETATDPYAAANARERIKTAQSRIQWYSAAIMRDAAAERAAQRGQTPPQNPSNDALRQQVEGEFNSLERVEQAAFSGIEVPAIGQPLTPAATIGGSPFISLENVTDDVMARMSAAQKLLVAMQYADKKDMIAGEMGVAIRELFQPENLPIMLGIGAAIFGLGAVAGAAAGSSGPPGWFTALVGVGFASLAVGNVGLKAYELKLELDSTTKVSEIPSSAKIAAELLAMIPIEVLIGMVAHVLGQLGGKVGVKAREFVRKWEEKEANRARNAKPDGDFENYGSETAETAAAGFRRSRKRINNKESAGPPQKGKEFEFRVEEGRIKSKQIRDREIDFIVTPDNQLRLGSGHAFMAANGDVFAAGRLKLDSTGRIVEVNNLSGHYRPSLIESVEFPDILAELGLNLRGARHKIYSQDMSSSAIRDDARLVLEYSELIP